MSDHKDAVWFDDEPTDNKVKAAYRELRLWQKGYLAALAGSWSLPTMAADQFVFDVNAKRAELLG